MVHLIKSLSTHERAAIENLLGRALNDDESLTIRPARILQAAPAGEERKRAFRGYMDHLDALAKRVDHIPEENSTRRSMRRYTPSGEAPCDRCFRLGDFGSRD